jgi:hypothetical protein
MKQNLKTFWVDKQNNLLQQQRELEREEAKILQLMSQNLFDNQAMAQLQNNRLPEVQKQLGDIARQLEQVGQFLQQQ